ncbi:metal-dependent hydrolase [Nonomuraea soli]|uniref:Ser-tRNA(Ala) deacylase AlaX n=1 Tax=Nonomuraea soli TaxID=1032476 RepID=A0A7W0CP64_9ACTN|nr:metal-dependent hydrolase [Nonomuraea soli]MBA2894786.1 Ser-tRNA(Ala) deacylase AlaX [Nonomuraea soli]
MVQHNVYLDDTYLTELDTEIVASDGLTWAAVRDNIFHPQGGGQPADRAWLGDQEVHPVKDHAGGLVVVEGAFAVGRPVRARVDRDLRLLHAALHTAGHLVEAAGRAQGWTMAAGNHFPGQARVEFDFVETAGARSLQEFVDRAIADDLKVAAELSDDGHRIVRLGDLHAAPCGGTHVGSLGDLASVRVTAVKARKGRTRVSYTATHAPSGTA